MSNLYGIGYSGLSAARAGLATAGNNISNVNTDGYTRQRAEFAPQTAARSASGVEVTGIERQYATYLNQQLNAASSQATALATHREQISQIDGLLGDASTGLAPRLQQFFAGLSTVASSPDDVSARQSLLGNARSLASGFNSFGEYLDQRADGVNKQIRADVKQINRLAKQVTGINRQITITSARTQSTPNALLDRRDQYVARLNELADVNVSRFDNGSYQVTLAGRSLVDGGGAHALRVVAADDGTANAAIGYQSANGTAQAIDASQITGGSLGGALRFRDQSLADTERGLNQLAHVFAATINDQHEAGADLRGDPGQALFSTSPPVTYASSDNRSATALTARFNGDPADVANSNYRLVSQGGGSYRLTTLATGESTTVSGSSFSIGGVDVSIENGAAAPGDSFVIKPVANAARDIGVAISDPAKIAAANDPSGGPGDNRNANKLAALQNANTVEGNRSFNNDYAQIVSRVGTTTRQLKASGDAQQALTQQLSKAQQSVSGVNLDEENINLLRFQQTYQANAKVIQTASAVFDTLLGIR